MKRPQFVTEEIYHIYNRGVEKRTICMDKSDYFRFVHGLYEFNDTAPSQNIFYKLPNLRSYEVGLRKKEPLVEIMCFCLMPNHYHLLLKQLVENGITLFMRKLGTGYTNYFNLKHKRVGALFQGIFKAVRVKREPHLLYLPHYIHLNPLDLLMPEWREQKIKNLHKALRFLETYNWSSYLDFIGKKNFPEVIKKDFLSEIYHHRTALQYKQNIREWLSEFDTEKISDVVIEDLRSPTS